MKVLCLLSLAVTAAVLLDSVNGTPSQQSSHDMSDAAGDRYLVCKIYGVLLRVLSIVVNIIATQTFDRMVCILCYWMWIGAGGSSVTSASPRARLPTSQPRPPAPSAACSGARPSPAPRSIPSCQPTLPGRWPRPWMDVDTAICGIGTRNKHISDYVTSYCFISFWIKKMHFGQGQIMPASFTRSSKAKGGTIQLHQEHQELRQYLRCSEILSVYVV